MPRRGRPPRWPTLLLATSCGLIAANIYVIQPINASRRLSSSAGGPIPILLALAVAALSTDAVVFLGAALPIGIGSVTVQVLVPYAAHRAPNAARGRVAGSVMNGLMLGIMHGRAWRASAGPGLFPDRAGRNPYGDQP
ncbi:hypothetical protein [Lichenicoccus sp.]|uniref:hypothetical protein n=1 Tax=Lichenicoccus sp. TaxID=2781899 RepID=UPI003D151626